MIRQNLLTIIKNKTKIKFHEPGKYALLFNIYSSTEWSEFSMNDKLFINYKHLI